MSSPNHSSDQKRIQRNLEQLRAVIMTGPYTIKQRRAQPENPNGAKQSMANPSPTTRTVTRHDIPEWWRDNKYILAGYRPLEADYWHIIKSLTFLLNETYNVYTYLIGAVLLPLFATTIL
ncbi:ADIPOR-like receptor IZH2 [Fusarium oxysporum f. sp. rapae]|uniref:ADIPOR-like receptor IZH2 n=1 Tax=Fusarium oxysporum f. sp. rapae TaxID=485398 RepID=A0A8J5TTG0_FUSOX|nr:ADIPOR-like receptor IZH2 [Fusarium oxysporum f. sp. rapae]